MSLFLFGREDRRMCARWRTTEGGEMFIYEGAGYMRFFEGRLIAIVRTYVIVYALQKRKPRRFG